MVELDNRLRLAADPVDGGTCVTYWEKVTGRSIGFSFNSWSNVLVNRESRGELGLSYAITPRAVDW